MSSQSASRILRRSLLVLLLGLGLLVGLTVQSACRLVVREAPARPFDVVIVPGCPSAPDGRLSFCQEVRAIWAARLWELGWARHFIVSGGAVHSPHVEAEALAAALAALGVPPSRVYLEPSALHTDENMYFSMQIARTLGLRHVAVASHGAAWGCQMLLDWGQPCGAVPLDSRWVQLRQSAVRAELGRVRTAAVSDWMPLGQRERAIARATGRRRRPPSALLYMSLGLMRLSGRTWVPAAVPSPPPIVTWASRLVRMPEGAPAPSPAVLPPGPADPSAAGQPAPRTATAGAAARPR